MKEPTLREEHGLVYAFLSQPSVNLRLRDDGPIHGLPVLFMHDNQL